MRPGQSTDRNHIVKEVQELENAYAEAFANGADERSLTKVWDRIRTLRREMGGRESEDDGRSASRQDS